MYINKLGGRKVFEGLTVLEKKFLMFFKYLNENKIVLLTNP